MEPLDISVCMIVKNESDHLERCLRSVHGRVAEIIIIDTGSTDDSPAISRRYGARIVRAPWENDFAKARNIGLERATSPWILVLDADEEVRASEWSSLPPLLAAPDVLGYYVKLVSFIGDTSHEESVVDSVCRLFRNHAHIRFRGAIHEEVVTSIREIPGSSLASCEFAIHHYGYLNEVILRKKKSERNLAIIRNVLQKYPEDILMRYALGTEFYQQGDYEKALSVFEPLISSVPVFSGYASDLLLKTAFALRMTNRTQKALRLIREGLVFFPDFVDLLELKAQLLIEEGSYLEAQETLHIAQKIGDVSSKYTTTSGAGTYRSEYMLGLIREKVCDWDAATTYYQRCLHLRPDYVPAWQRWLPLAFASGETEPLLSLLLAKTAPIPKNVFHIVMQMSLLGQRADITQRLVAAFGQPAEALASAIRLILAAQSNDEPTTSALLRNMIESAHVQPTHLLYAWAVAWKRHDDAEALAHLEQMACFDTSYSAIVRMLRGEEDVRISETACRNCQQVLIQIGAWEELLKFLNLLPPDGELPLLAASFYWALDRSPSAIKAGLLQQFQKRAERLQFQELVWSGKLAIDCEDYQEAHRLFQIAAEHKPHRLEPRLGLACLYQLLAIRLNDGISGAHKPSDRLRFLSVAVE
jgi:glycosyltransferase involved in cell wall biosynthesis